MGPALDLKVVVKGEKISSGFQGWRRKERGGWSEGRSVDRGSGGEFWSFILRSQIYWVCRILAGCKV